MNINLKKSSATTEISKNPYRTVKINYFVEICNFVCKNIITNLT